MIYADNLHKSYGRTPVLRGLSFRATRGEVTLMVGPNGAGKSTTVKILAGLIHPQSGTARVNCFDIVRQKIAAQRSLAYLPQSPNFHPHLTCIEILLFYARLRGLPRARCEAMLDLAGLRGSARVRTGELSGGMRQRLGVGLLMLPDAPVLLLDEPGLSLDPTWRKRLQNILHLEARHGKTVLITTHLIAEWNNVADRCFLCREGKIEHELDPTNLPHNFDEMEILPFTPTARGQSALGSACAPRAGDGTSPSRPFSGRQNVSCLPSTKRFGEGAETCTRGACAPQSE